MYAIITRYVICPLRDKVADRLKNNSWAMITLPLKPELSLTFLLAVFGLKGAIRTAHL